MKFNREQSTTEFERNLCKYMCAQKQDRWSQCIKHSAFKSAFLILTAFPLAIGSQIFATVHVFMPWFDFWAERFLFFFFSFLFFLIFLFVFPIPSCFFFLLDPCLANLSKNFLAFPISEFSARFGLVVGVRGMRRVLPHVTCFRYWAMPTTWRPHAAEKMQCDRVGFSRVAAWWAILCRDQAVCVHAHPGVRLLCTWLDLMCPSASWYSWRRMLYPYARSIQKQRSVRSVTSREPHPRAYPATKFRSPEFLELACDSLQLRLYFVDVFSRSFLGTRCNHLASLCFCDFSFCFTRRFM